MLEALTNIDLSILHAIRANIATPLLDEVMPFVTSLGNLAFIWFVIAALLLSKKEYRFYGAVVIAAIAAACIIGEIGIKNVVERPRPFLVDPSLAIGLIAPPSSFSFPSGHTGSSFAAATALCFLPMAHAWFKAVPLCGAACIAFSRLYLCVHYPSDVVGGIIVGVVSGIIGMLIVRFLVRRKENSANCENAQA
ncbi:MAG: phosphatase PAP2 family protein [Slackia sp.]|nr:phosphatase PAP2 family protein [Slackia sp.]